MVERSHVMLAAVTGIRRRDAIAILGAAGASFALPRHAGAAGGPAGSTSMIVCMIRYQIDPFQRDAFAEYARTWGPIIPACGGHLVGYFLPHEGTNDVGWGLIGFESLAAYEAYRARLRTDARAQENFTFAQTRRFILREERTFVEVVGGTFNLPPK